MVKSRGAKIRSDAKRNCFLYLTQWRESKGLSVEQVAHRLEVSRQTVYRSEVEQWRLDPGKLAALADAMGMRPEQFWRMPDCAPSIDAMLADQPNELRDTVADIVRCLIRRGKNADKLA